MNFNSRALDFRVLPEAFIMRLKDQLYQTFPILTWGEAMKRDIFFAVFLIMFLLVFTPFGLDVFAYDRYYIIVGYGLATYASILMNDTVAYGFFPTIFSERNWKVYKQILWAIWHLLCVGLANLTYGVAVGAFPLTFLSFLKLELYVVLCSILPITIVILIRQNYLVRKNSATAESINAEIHLHPNHPDVTPGERLVVLTAENNRDHLKIPPSDIVFISAEENYAEVVTEKEGKMSKQLIRSTLSRIEETLKTNPAFFRCHRAYLVNTERIVSVEGNSQGCRLHLNGTPELIPVSRSKVRALREVIHDR